MVLAVLGPHQALRAVGVPHARVQVAARAGLGHRPLRHERGRHAVQLGDLLHAVLVQRVVVGVRQRVGVGDVDLLLALAELALAELDRDARAQHARCGPDG